MEDTWTCRWNPRTSIPRKPANGWTRCRPWSRTKAGRAHLLLDQLIDQDRAGAGRYATPNTPYINTIPVSARRPSPATPVWNCGWTPICAGTPWPWCCAPARPQAWAGTSLTYASATTLYKTGYRHFFRAATPEFLGDMLYIQGHSAPGIYARAYLEGRLSEDELDRFRREIGGGGLASYPHPRTMPGFWQFPTVSMGLGR